jgi:hypothetical protein
MSATQKMWSPLKSLFLSNNANTQHSGYEQVADAPPEKLFVDRVLVLFSQLYPIGIGSASAVQHIARAQKLMAAAERELLHLLTQIPHSDHYALLDSAQHELVWMVSTVGRDSQNHCAYVKGLFDKAMAYEMQMLNRLKPAEPTEPAASDYSLLYACICNADAYAMGPATLAAIQTRDDQMLREALGAAAQRRYTVGRSGIVSVKL